MSDEEQQNEEGSDQKNLKDELEKAMNGWRRAQADFENYKKQKERENREMLEFAKEVTVVKLLPTLDTLAKALKHIPVVSGQWTVGSEETKEFSKAYENWQVGIKGILMQLDQALGELGVKKIEAVGKKFDPHFHEAIKEIEGEADGMIAEEMQTGFELNGKVIRPTQVTIFKKTIESGE
ncbi:MAG: nucleotide exchange factor GrpE [Candidatus Doudnabacteria bacterium]|nr:nucleotide exchange factor GrpE [Candidatus Doudnabacteria bacterium]